MLLYAVFFSITFFQLKKKMLARCAHFSIFFSLHFFNFFLIFFCRCLIKADRTKDLSDEGLKGYAFSIQEIVRDPVDASKSRAMRTHVYWADTDLERDEWVTVLQKYAGAYVSAYTYTHTHTDLER